MEIQRRSNLIQIENKENITGAYLLVEMNTYCYIVITSCFFMCDLPFCELSFLLPVFIRLSHLLPSLVQMCPQTPK